MAAGYLVEALDQLYATKTRSRVCKRVGEGYYDPGDGADDFLAMISRLVCARSENQKAGLGCSCLRKGGCREVGISEVEEPQIGQTAFQPSQSQALDGGGD